MQAVSSFARHIAQRVKQLLYRKKYFLTSSEVLNAAIKFVVNECIEGDYYEFGVYKGQTTAAAYHGLLDYADRRIRSSSKIGSNPISDRIRQSILHHTKFHAFDSFQGLPDLSEIDSYSADFAKSQFSCSLSDYLCALRSAGVSLDRIQTHPGWFSSTCNHEYFLSRNLAKASIIWLDADLYSSTTDALELVSFLIQDGTVIVIDDWFCNKGSPFYGVQRAFSEWSQSPSISSKYVFTEYQRDSWKRLSFITSSLPQSSHA